MALSRVPGSISRFHVLIFIPLHFRNVLKYTKFSSCKDRGKLYEIYNTFKKTYHKFSKDKLKFFLKLRNFTKSFFYLKITDLYPNFELYIYGFPQFVILVCSNIELLSVFCF